MNFFSISAGVLDFDEKSSIAHTPTVDISCLGEKQTKNVFFGVILVINHPNELKIGICLDQNIID